jgi:hypothetical protein
LCTISALVVANASPVSPPSSTTPSNGAVRNRMFRGLLDRIKKVSAKAHNGNNVKKPVSSGSAPSPSSPQPSSSFSDNSPPSPVDNGPTQEQQAANHLGLIASVF